MVAKSRLGRTLPHLEKFLSLDILTYRLPRENTPVIGTAALDK